MNTTKQSYQYATRKEIEITLDIVEGKLPEDIYGVVYLTTMCGSINSQGLPIPEKHPGDSYDNPEFGTPQVAGDGMLFKIDFNYPGEVHLKTFISKPPCYYADLATSRDNTPGIERQFRNYGFRSAGVSRASLQLGFRNKLSVAVIPFQFQNDIHPRMMVTFDAGRPWEFNTETLKLITPIEKYKRWIKGIPPNIAFPFALIQNSAHPSFDASTKEFYTVNYTQVKAGKYQIAFLLMVLLYRDKIRKNRRENGLINKVRNVFDKIAGGILKRLLQDTPSDEEDENPEDIDNALHSVLNSEDSRNEVFLMKWNGRQEALKKWKVLDENGNDIVIQECMHQTALTEDYILLADSSFKISANQLVNNPIPDDPEVGEMFRKFLNRETLPDMPLYLVRRKDLKDDVSTVNARRISLPADCIHFVANYRNPGNNITLYTMNNNSVCVSEWIRPFDTLKIGGKPVYKELVGLPAMAALDLGSLTKYVINYENGIVEELVCAETGGPSGQVSEAHTWELALMTHRDMIAPDRMVDEIKNLFVFSVGLNSQKLTDFIYELFKDVPDKRLSTEEVLDYTKEGVRLCLFRLDTSDMKIKDFYLPDFNTEIRSLQFIPAKQEREGVEYSMNGYILCIMMVGESTVPNASCTMNYKREFWIFDACDLARGPVCKLSHPKLSYSFTLHSAWIAEAKEQECNYYVDIKKDFSDPKSFWPGASDKNLREFFEKYVFPNFKKDNV